MFSPENSSVTASSSETTRPGTCKTAIPCEGLHGNAQTFTCALCSEINLGVSSPAKDSCEAQNSEVEPADQDKFVGVVW